jgi:hypothetical protein
MQLYQDFYNPLNWPRRAPCGPRAVPATKSEGTVLRLDLS